jgi:hypothetical protein
MVGEYVFSNAHNSNFTPKFATSFYPSYFAAQEANVAPKVFATKQVFRLMDLHLVQVAIPGLEEFE